MEKGFSKEDFSELYDKIGCFFFEMTMEYGEEMIADAMEKFMGCGICVEEECDE